MKGNIRDWVLEANKRRVKLGIVETDKIQDGKILQESGLPCFQEYNLPYPKFKKENKSLLKFLAKYEQFTIRAIPGREGLKRDVLIGVKSFEKCKKFLDKIIGANGKDYTVSIRENEENDGGGIIISNGKTIRGEFSHEGLANLSYGKVVPDVSCVVDLSVEGGLEDKIDFYCSNGKNYERIIRGAIKYLERNNSYMLGYFEFLLTKSGRTIFWDYKTERTYTL